MTAGGMQGPANEVVRSLRKIWAANQSTRAPRGVDAREISNSAIFAALCQQLSLEAIPFFDNQPGESKEKHQEEKNLNGSNFKLWDRWELHCSPPMVCQRNLPLAKLKETNKNRVAAFGNVSIFEVKKKKVGFDVSTHGLEWPTVFIFPFLSIGYTRGDGNL